MPIDFVITADAGSTRVFINPVSQTINAIGDSFTVNVSVADVTNLYSYEFKLYYNSTVMNGTQVIEGSFLKSGGQTFYYKRNFTDHYDLTHGVVYIVCLLLENVSGVSGSGVLTTIKFKSVSVGDFVPLHLVDVALYDSSGSQIPHEVLGGTATVVPEFTSLFAVLTLIVASLLVVLVWKRAKRKVPCLSYKCLCHPVSVYRKTF
jgi:hypothetical protein